MQAVIRITFWAVAVAVILGCGFGGFESVAIGQVIGSHPSSTLSLGQLILRENFDDNERSVIWRTHVEDPRNCTLVERNGRLELQTTASAAGAWAMYVSNAWRFDPQFDFAMKVDLQYTPLTYAKGWIGFGLTCDAERPRQQQIGVGIGASSMYSHFWFRTVDGICTDTSTAPRFKNSATIYLSYCAEADELYVGDGGYGVDNAWLSFPGLIKGQWNGKPLYIWLGGTSDGLSLTSGQAFLDNLMIENGDLLEASLRDVYRFWSPKTGRHFYTINSDEKERLLIDYPLVWKYEGAVFAAFCDDSDPLTRPVHRFWSDKLSTHFYTIDEQEKDKLIKEQQKIWTYEGVAFYVYPSGLQPQMTQPVYRFWSPVKGGHFYTTDEAEKEMLIAKYPRIWTYEGVAWYALR